MITLTVVVPSLNDAEMLQHCLAALAAQTRPADEVLVVDNGSVDDTVRVAREWGARVVSEPRRGVLRATAAGFDAARCTVIGRLDADSRPAPEWAAQIVDRFAADPTLDALTGNGHFYGGGPIRRFIGRRIYIGGYLFLFGAALGRMPLFGSNLALRRETWRQIRPRVHLDDPRAHDDLEISLALGPRAGVDYDPRLRVGVSVRPLYSWRAFVRRAAWAFHQLAVHLREESWPRRVIGCARGRRARRGRQRALGVRAGG